MTLTNGEYLGSEFLDNGDGTYHGACNVPVDASGIESACSTEIDGLKIFCSSSGLQQALSEAVLGYLCPKLRSPIAVANCLGAVALNAKLCVPDDKDQSSICSAITSLIAFTSGLMYVSANGLAGGLFQLGFIEPTKPTSVQGVATVTSPSKCEETSSMPTTICTPIYEKAIAADIYCIEDPINYCFYEAWTCQSTCEKANEDCIYAASSWYELDVCVDEDLACTSTFYAASAGCQDAQDAFQETCGSRGWTSLSNEVVQIGVMIVLCTSAR